MEREMGARRTVEKPDGRADHRQRAIEAITESSRAVEDCCDFLVVVCLRFCFDVDCGLIGFRNSVSTRAAAASSWNKNPKAPQSRLHNGGFPPSPPRGGLPRPVGNRLGRSRW